MMNKDKEKDKGIAETELEEIKIDYDNIDVNDIMTQIRKRVSVLKKNPEVETAEYSDSSDSPPLYKGPESPETGLKAKIKNILLKIMKPFAPVIKFLVYPVHKELRDTIEKLDETNRRLDDLVSRRNPVFLELKSDIKNLEEVMIKSEGNINERIDMAFKDIHKLKEYTGLLHNLSHNLVVEMTKLKIEEENIKLKARIMEKDFEFLGKKENALEREIYK